MDKNLIDVAKIIINATEYASNNARVDGIRFEPSALDAKTVDVLYKKTRSQHFNWEEKKKIMLGYFILSKNNFQDYYVKAKKIVEQGGAKC